METSIPVQRTTTPRRRTPETELGFGKVFSDHMFLMDHELPAGWHQPRIVPYGPLSMDPAATVFHYGQAMFEGMKAFRGRDGKVRMFRPLRHFERLAEGAGRLCMPAPDPAQMVKMLRSLIELEADWVPRSEGTALYIRPTLIAHDVGLGVRAAQKYLLFIILSPVGAYYPDGWNPLRIWIEDRYVRAAPGGLGAVKAAANYASSLLASEEAKRRGFSQVLWLDSATHSNIEEVGTMNLFVRIGDEVLTAPLEGTILGGITRDSVITLLREWGVKVTERRISVEELAAAHHSGSLREVFGCGTASVIAPVKELTGARHSLVINNGQAGELSRRLYEAITQIQYGEREDTHSWMMAVEPERRDSATKARAAATA